MSELQFAIPTLFGLEGVCADELRRLNLPGVRAENGRVLCAGTEQDLPRLNVNVRTGERVLLVIGSFPARDFDALFEGVFFCLPCQRRQKRDRLDRRPLENTQDYRRPPPRRFPPFFSM